MDSLRIFLLTMFVAVLLSACAPPATGPSQPQENNSAPNPAAVYCSDQGYQYEIRKDDQGNEYGVCIFDDGTECDAWAYFRGECGQDKAKNLALNLVQTANLAQTVRIDVLARKTSSVDPDASRHPSIPGMEIIFTVSDPATIQSLIKPLDATLPLTPPMRCPAQYALQFHLQTGETQTFQLGICGLYGDQPYFKGLTIRPPEAFVSRFNELLEKAGFAAK